ncbi:MAG: hypothetical protein A2268_09850 [Candidatus Raymondbacteria bacterium RifOxyA12_full_50_37]|uniref:Helix-hairpin-helix DNA-binding motif class 1 domain-containing protein n=1 Tax=Candidatus Raymondbacteria bacterium RIFOXYD12_FULL_49_13 TaxID=1817890 RepID=A0A1F7F1G1_UNCRA|nr:MAG: hypothetical protein A2268_09850 [Candidatus Raymondbacteria bacterium RifOxyA12_full_50_37]OGJ93859.1 MAG: hypothetical protein A2248_06445 [Candidatus Raymondbacteria bacterium RIFOXYA2_FULL_49_16]OGJ98272.1 MAG: hypothetical protein A2453_00720 [Candidatus Raymondbacteria bacterium RIFOXYC2_FULL_50_21]OGJ98436.1 MAG: hypothetical protein A2350_14350 [Candidatus Raymondbacteria bacterium RifOxyB12_full_50_8]OGK00505.1 MAG: hypothetical protein A2519_10895 [Candidatus Raymondbacteria b
MFTKNELAFLAFVVLCTIAGGVILVTKGPVLQPVLAVLKNENASAPCAESIEHSESASETKSMQQCVNINTAQVSELVLLPGVGQKTAENIVAFRNKHGRFWNMNDVVSVKGVGKKKLEKLKHLITF